MPERSGRAFAQVKSRPDVCPRAGLRCFAASSRSFHVGRILCILLDAVSAGTRRFDIRCVGRSLERLLGGVFFSSRMPKEVIMTAKPRLRFAVALAPVVALSWGLEASAQGISRPEREFESPAILVMGWPPIRVELKLKPEQVEQLKDLALEYRNELSQERDRAGIDLRALRNASPEEKQQKTEQMHEITKKVAGSFEAKVNEILNKAQRVRLREVWLQRADVNALEQPDVAKELGLTKEQTNRLAVISKDADGKVRQLLLGNEDRRKLLPKVQEIRRDQSVRALKF